MNVRISLGDYGKNGVCDWSITADIYEKRRNGRFIWCASGCCHEEILKCFPQFKTFIDLHLCNHYGQPMYPAENGVYHLVNSDKEKVINYLRITETEYEKKRNEIIADFEKEIQKAENRKLAMLAVLDAGISLKNAIYYNHTNELAFNWNDYEEKVTQEQFDKFVNTVDKTKLPENITFKLNKL